MQKMHSRNAKNALEIAKNTLENAKNAVRYNFMC